MLYAGKWMELESIVLSEISQSEKGNINVLSDMWNTDQKMT
jgi:hypothetical protein